LTEGEKQSAEKIRGKAIVRTEDTDVERVESSLQAGVIGGGRGEVDGVDLSLDGGVLGGCTRRRLSRLTEGRRERTH
jgi:hypothetical protein